MRKSEIDPSSPRIPPTRESWRRSLGGAMVVLASVFILACGPLHAEPRAPAAETAPLARLSDATEGTLALRNGRGDERSRYLAAPMLKTVVGMRVTGMVARVTVEQHFTNPTTEWQEGVYIFPLPEKAAVDYLKMRIGDRQVEGRIQERGEARRTYEAAKSEGRKAALVEQERPNIFTNNVAHIGPRETVIVEIEYQQTLHYDQGAFRLRFPMTMTPRYIPGDAASVTIAPQTPIGASGWARNTNEVADAARITPPVAHPASGHVNQLSLSVDLDAGFPLAALDSSYHAIDVTPSGAHQLVRLKLDAVPANRDFELVWRPQLVAAPQAALFHEIKDNKHYALLMVLPPAPAAAAATLPREVIFIIDTSGSMEGTSIGQAKEALQMALGRLKSGDHFNIIQFNSVTDKLFAEAVPVNETSLRRARDYVAALRATGGTEMLPALRAALDGKENPNMLRQVLFLTDGAVGNEQALFEFIQANLGGSRLFTVGIGSAPNSHFMTRAAQFGRGTFTYIGSISEVKEKMSALFAKVESPVLANLSIRWPAGQQVDMWPARLPDLYAGEPLIVSAQLDQLAGSIVIEGSRGATPWRQVLPLAGGRAEAGISTLWAREKIDGLMSTLRMAENESSVRDAVIATALAHHLVSQYTSMVAVDVTPTAPVGTDAKTALVTTSLPEGASYEAIFGNLPQTATAAEINLLAGMLLLVTAFGIWWGRRGR